MDNLDLSYVQNITDQAGRNSQYSSMDRLASSNLSKNSTYEELEEATKSFESYFVEQIMKSVKESIDDLKSDEEKNSSASQQTDMFMDQTLSELSDMMIDQYGGRITRDLTNSMAHQYGIEIPEDKQ